MPPAEHQANGNGSGVNGRSLVLAVTVSDPVRDIRDEDLAQFFEQE